MLSGGPVVHGGAEAVSPINQTLPLVRVAPPTVCVTRSQSLIGSDCASQTGEREREDPRDGPCESNDELDRIVS